MYTLSECIAMIPGAVETYKAAKTPVHTGALVYLIVATYRHPMTLEQEAIARIARDALEANRHIAAYAMTSQSIYDDAAFVSLIDAIDSRDASRIEREVFNLDLSLAWLTFLERFHSDGNPVHRDQERVEVAVSMLELATEAGLLPPLPRIMTTAGTLAQDAFKDFRYAQTGINMLLGLAEYSAGKGLRQDAAGND